MQYPLVELLTGAVFSLVALKLWNYGLPVIPEVGLPEFWPTFIFWSTTFSILIAISLYDLRHKIIPNQLVYTLVVLSLAAALFPNSLFLIHNSSVWAHVLSGALAFFFFAALWFVSGGRWMGFGDAKLALGLGFFLGPEKTFVAIVLSFWIGALAALPLLFLGKTGLKAQIPFAPFLALGAFIAWLLGDTLTHFYLGFF